MEDPEESDCPDKFINILRLLRVVMNATVLTDDCGVKWCEARVCSRPGNVHMFPSSYHASSQRQTPTQN